MAEHYQLLPAMGAHVGKDRGVRSSDHSVVFLADVTGAVLDQDKNHISRAKPRRKESRYRGRFVDHWFLAPTPLFVVALLTTVGVFLLLAGTLEHPRVERVAIELVLLLPASWCFLRYKRAGR